jgi:integrase
VSPGHKALSRFFGWLAARDLVDVNPVRDTETWSAGRGARVLSDAEIAPLWQATEGPGAYHLILRLLLWAGARRSEVGGMAWGELDGEVWTVLGDGTKNHRPLALPLPRQAVDALKAWPRVLGRPHLFGRGKDGFGGWSQSKARLDDRIARARAERRLGRPLAKGEKPAKEDALADWDIHDLRRTVETRMAGLGYRRTTSTACSTTRLGRSPRPTTCTATCPRSARPEAGPAMSKPDPRCS